MQEPRRRLGANPKENEGTSSRNGVCGDRKRYAAPIFAVSLEQ